MKKKKLSPGQKRVYDKLVAYLKRYGVYPDLSEFADDLEIGYMSLRQHLRAMHDKGHLTFESRGRGKSPFLRLPPAVTGVRVLGNITAGLTSASDQHVEGYLHVPMQTNNFALRVYGHSMADIIQDGDVVLLKPGRPERSGQICAVRVGEGDTTLKYLDWVSKDVWRLRPHNDEFETVEEPLSNLNVDGVYQGLLRGDILWTLYEEA
jgi:SOS-response transcriptional repressor LexA